MAPALDSPQWSLSVAPARLEDPVPYFAREPLHTGVGTTCSLSNVSVTEPIKVATMSPRREIDNSFGETRGSEPTLPRITLSKALTSKSDFLVFGISVGGFLSRGGGK